MSLLHHQPALRERPLGVTLIAAVHVLIALVSLIIAVGTFAGRMPLASGAFLVGGELETAGPILFLLVALVFLISAIGLFYLKNWARHLAVGLALQGGKCCRQRALAAASKRAERHSVLSAPPRAACAAASRAIGTR